jgi:hypothetical protein
LFKRAFVFLFCLVLLATTGVPARAQQTMGQYFPETGHNVVGDFYTFYQGIPDATLVFGYPITEEFVNLQGIKVQYFQRARLEWRPEMPAGQQVQLTSLGQLLYAPGAPSLPLNIPGACRSFPTGFSICYDFLTFYDQHGGAARFGNPISAFEFQPDGRIVQHFERARFEWHPELPRGQNVTLTDLGRIYFDYSGEDQARLPRVQPQDTGSVSPPTILSLRTMAFVWKAVTQPSDTQRIYVIVQDQTLTPVPNARVSVTVNLSVGPAWTRTISTDANGIAVFPDVAFTDQIYGSLIVVSVQVEMNGLTANTTTSFRIWR